ncbi:hypothetical protein [Hyphobacterium sp.]|uniref:hypothetical protein n=1 Tax=Hyphobacterium sp. TaxID=2004662 RepID=UPI003BAC9EFD
MAAATLVLSALRGGAAALRPFLPWIAAGVLGAVVWHLLPPLKVGPLQIFAGGAGARLETLKEDLTEQTTARREAETARDGWERSYRESEANREAEREQSREAFAAQEEYWQLRVEEARSSALAIGNLFSQNEVRYDANNCPVRELIDAGELRLAIGAAAAPD